MTTDVFTSDVSPSDTLRFGITPDLQYFKLKPDGTWGCRFGRWTHSIIDRKAVKKFEDQNIFFIGATDHNAKLIHDSWARSQISFASHDAELVYNQMLAKHEVRRIGQLAQASWLQLLNSSADEEAAARRQLTTLSEHPELPLAGYQKLATSISSFVGNYALLMEQGTGKTPCVISRICTDVINKEKQYNGRMHRSLIIVPKALRLNWQREIDRFKSVPGKATVIRGGLMKRIKAFAGSFVPTVGNERFTCVIVSYGYLVESLELFKGIEWDLCVLDEGHGIKSHSTQRTKACHEIRDHANNRMLLTGTPICNTALDLWAQLEFLEKGASGFHEWNNFKTQYGIFQKSRDGNRDMLAGLQRVPQLKEQLSRVSFIVRKEQVLKDLPEKQYDVVEVEMTKQQRTDYESLAHSLMIKFENAMSGVENAGQRAMVVNNILTQLLRLAQITSGFLVIPEEHGEDGEIISEREVIRYTPNAKLDVLFEEIERLPSDEKMIIWACWREDIDAIRNRFNEKGIEAVYFQGDTRDSERDEAVRRFNEDRSLRFFVGNQAAGGVGLNLIGYPPGREAEYETDCTRAVYYSQNWSFQHRDQSEARSHRRGTRRPVRVTDLCVPDSIDEEIRARVVEKKIHALDVQDLYSIFKKVTECQD